MYNPAETIPMTKFQQLENNVYDVIFNYKEPLAQQVKERTRAIEEGLKDLKKVERYKVNRQMGGSACGFYKTGAGNFESTGKNLIEKRKV